MTTNISNYNKFIEQPVQSKKPSSIFDSFGEGMDEVGNGINALVIKPLRIIANTFFTATNAILTDRPTSLETALAVPAFIYGKEALSHGSNCVSLNAGRNLLFGDISSTINTYWTSKSWTELFSTKYLTSIYDGLIHVSGRLSIEEMGNVIGRYLSAKSPEEVRDLIENSITQEMKESLGTAYEGTITSIQANLQDVNKIPTTVVPTTLSESFLTKFAKNLDKNILEKFNDAECLRFSGNSKFAAPFIVAIVALIVGRISYKVVTSTCSDIYQKYLAKPSSNETLNKAVEDVKTVVGNVQSYLGEIKKLQEELLEKSDTDLKVEESDEGIEVEECETEEDDEESIDEPQLSKAQFEALLKLAKQKSKA